MENFTTVICMPLNKQLPTLLATSVVVYSKITVYAHRIYRKGIHNNFYPYTQTPPVWRVKRSQKRRKFHIFQHLYMPFIYSLVSSYGQQKKDILCVPNNYSHDYEPVYRRPSSFGSKILVLSTGVKEVCSYSGIMIQL